ncbi:MAG: efflux RND transporter periplasmic adaptor subunit [Porticoccaceae bacterium]|nr:efflux RND transporter periplasmic adaptor subunit [Porticoccaceae bacterium]
MDRKHAFNRLAFLRILVILVFTGNTAVADIAFAPLAELVEYPRISASATVISLSDTDISARITAEVAEVIADTGSRVKKGELLLTLDCSDYELAVAIAQAQLDGAKANKVLAKNQYERSRQLLGRKLTSQQDVDATEAAYSGFAAAVRSAEAALKQTRVDASRCQIFAPFDAVVKARHVSKGQLAVPGTALLALIDGDNLEVSARVNELDGEKISPQTAFVFAGNRDYPLVLLRSVAAIDPVTRTQELRLGFSAEKPLPGTAGKVVWNSPVPHLPPRYLVNRNGATGFFIVKDARVSFVALDNAFPGKSQPVSLSLDTLVVTDSLGTVQDGDSISSGSAGN